MTVLSVIRFKLLHVVKRRFLPRIVKMTVVIGPGVRRPFTFVLFTVVGRLKNPTRHNRQLNNL